MTDYLTKSPGECGAKGWGTPDPKLSGGPPSDWVARDASGRELAAFDFSTPGPMKVLRPMQYTVMRAADAAMQPRAPERKKPRDE